MSTSLPYSPPIHQGNDVLFVDDYLLAVHKPSGLLSVPGRGVDKQDCATNRVQIDFPSAKVVHRLDMSTSGIMLFALTVETQSALSRLFELRQIEKTYFAIVDGFINNVEGIIDKPLICDWPNRPKQKIDLENGKHAITAYRVLQYYEDDKTTRVRLTPKTGRSHQLRVHMASIGHPILGDELYGSEDICKKANRLLLHATEISFDHPVTALPIKINSPCPF